jgi:6-phosphofructokinase 1
MNTAMEMVDRLRDTAQSHDRCSVVEVMGRRAGFLALQCGIAVGATAILVPEIDFDLNDVINKIKESQQTGKKHFIIIVAEGVGGVEEISKQIEEATGIETRATILGHVQRGGRPTVRDRVYATRFAYAAVQLLDKGIGNRVVGMKHGVIVDYDIYEALNMQKPFDKEMFEVARMTSI